MLVNQNLYKKSSKTQKIRCEICANYCKIADGNVGVCRQHKNINGELFDLPSSPPHLSQSFANSQVQTYREFHR